VENSTSTRHAAARAAAPAGLSAGESDCAATSGKSRSPAGRAGRRPKTALVGEGLAVQSPSPAARGGRGRLREHGKAM